MGRKKKHKIRWHYPWMDTLRHRWMNTMPKFFRVIFWVCSLVSGTAIAINTAIISSGGVTHDWWVDIYPYIVGIPAGMAFVAKFTQVHGRDGKPIDYDDYRRNERQGRTILDKDDF